MIEARGLGKSYLPRGGKSVPALKNIDLHIPEGQFFTLLGPSGCGKSTTLRCIAGLERPDSGEILIDGRVVYSSERHIHVPPERRRLAMVFQSYAIWPHMTCAENVAFPLQSLPRGQRPSRAVTRERVEQALATVRLDGMSERPATALSGGQKQRLALARALVIEPKVMLLDEPLSNLDAKLRENLRLELRSLQRSLNLTVLYVTHDQTEALSMSNLIAVMSEGRVEQVGAPREIYNRPATDFVARFVGEANTLAGAVVAAPDTSGRVHVETNLGRLLASTRVALAPGDACELLFRPEYVELEPLDSLDESERRQGFAAQVTRAVFYGEYLLVEIDVAGEPMQVRVHPSLEYRRGDKVWVALHPDNLHVLPGARQPPAVEQQPSGEDGQTDGRFLVRRPSLVTRRKQHNPPSGD